VAALGLARAAHCCFQERFRAGLDDGLAGVDREADPVEARTVAEIERLRRGGDATEIVEHGDEIAA